VLSVFVRRPFAEMTDDDRALSKPARLSPTVLVICRCQSGVHSQLTTVHYYVSGVHFSDVIDNSVLLFCSVL